MRTIAFGLILILMVPALAMGMVQVKYEGSMAAKEPINVVVDSDGLIYALLKSGEIQVMDSAGKVVRTIGGKDKKWRDIIKSPTSIAFSKGSMYVTDDDLGRVSVLTKEGALQGSFGSRGSKAKQFGSPKGLFIYDGLIYVADESNKNVQILGSNGVYLGSIEGQGEGSERLKKPTDVIVDHRGYIYVLDPQDSMIKVYDQKGKFLKSVPEVRSPGKMVLDQDGIYVADTSLNSIIKFDFDLKRVMSFGTKGKGRAQFVEISGLAVDKAGKVYVADSDRDDIQVFFPEKEGEPAPKDYVSAPTSVVWVRDIDMKTPKIEYEKGGDMIAIEERNKSVHVLNREGKFKLTVEDKKWKPIAASLGPDGNLWMIEGKKKKIVKLDAKGAFLFEFGESGSNPGYFKDPSDITVSTDGLVYVADTGNGRVQIFNTDGVFMKVVGKGGTDELLESPVALCLDDDNNLYVLDDRRRSVIIFSREGRMLKEIGGKGPDERFIMEKPVDLTASRDEIFVLDSGSKRVMVFNKLGTLVRSFGAEGGERGDFSDPTSITIRDGIRLFVSDMKNGKIQEFLNIYTPKPPRNLTASGGTRTVRLAWDSNEESYVNQYRVYKLNNTTKLFEEAGVTDRNNFIDKDVEPDKKYIYTVASLAREGNESVKIKPVEAVPTKYIAQPPAGLKAEPKEWAVTLNWDNSDENVKKYFVYRMIEGKLERLAETEQPTFIEGLLKSDAEYEYFVSAVSVDGVESKHSSVKTKTLVATRPPIEIDVVHMSDIFSNTYKVYETDGIGRIKLTNNTSNNISRLKVSFAMKGFMDFPSETEVTDLGPGQSKEVDVKAVFNNLILDVSEDTPAQTSITVSYYSNQELRKYSKNHSINVYDKHKMTWDIPERMAAFVTTKDPVLMEFTREVVTQYRDTDEPFLYAGVLFDAVGAMGMTYIIDPSNSYQVTSANTSLVDYLQYPRETLKRKSGDCDDLVILFSAALESVGIPIKVLDIPGHMFMMFSIGTVAELGDDTMDGLFVIYEDRVWVPLEATMVGQNFLKAWEKASKTYYEYAKKNQIGVMGLQDAWARFKPASLPNIDWRPEKITRDMIEQKSGSEFTELRKIRVKIRSMKHISELQDNPRNVNAFLQLGIVYAESGEVDESLKVFNKALELDPQNPALLNNIGNLHFMKAEYEQAAKQYESAVRIDPYDTNTWINLTRAYLALNRKGEAKQAFENAYKIDNDVARKFRGMSLKLLGPTI